MARDYPATRDLECVRLNLQDAQREIERVRDDEAVRALRSLWQSVNALLRYLEAGGGEIQTHNGHPVR